MSTLARAPIVPATVRTLRHQVESQARHIEILEQRLRQTMGDAGLHSDTVELLTELPRRPTEDYRRRIWNKITRTPKQTPSPALHATDASWWPRIEQSEPPLTPAPGWGCYEIGNQAGKVLGISVFGLESEKLSQTLALIADQQRKTRDFTPVFLTSSTDFHLFRRYGFVFEYLPAADRRDGVVGQQSWHDYAAQRLELICRKWGLARIICFSSQAIGSW